MSIFDTLAENRYQQWLEQKAKPGYQAPASASGTPCKTSYEARVYREAITRLQKAAVAGMLTKALNELRSELGLPVSMSARRIT